MWRTRILNPQTPTHCILPPNLLFRTLITQQYYMHDCLTDGETISCLLPNYRATYLQTDRQTDRLFMRRILFPSLPHFLFEPKESPTGESTCILADSHPLQSVHPSLHPSIRRPILYSIYLHLPFTRPLPHFAIALEWGFIIWLAIPPSYHQSTDTKATCSSWNNVIIHEVSVWWSIYPSANNPPGDW